MYEPLTLNAVRVSVCRVAVAGRLDIVTDIVRPSGFVAVKSVVVPDVRRRQIARVVDENRCIAWRA